MGGGGAVFQSDEIIFRILPRIASHVTQIGKPQPLGRRSAQRQKAGFRSAIKTSASMRPTIIATQRTARADAVRSA